MSLNTNFCVYEFLFLWERREEALKIDDAIEFECQMITRKWNEGLIFFSLWPGSVLCVCFRYNFIKFYCSWWSRTNIIGKKFLSAWDFMYENRFNHDCFFFLGEKPWEMWSGKWSKNHQQLCNFSLEFFDHGKVYEKVKRMTKFTATKKKEKKEKLLRLLHSLDVIHKWKCLGNVMQSH